jgi:hypothetical protein
MCWCQILEITIEEFLEQQFRDPLLRSAYCSTNLRTGRNWEGKAYREDSLSTEDIEGQENVNAWISWNNPFVRSRKDVCLLGILMSSKFKSFNSTCSASNNNHVLSLCLLAGQARRVVDLSFELIHAGDMWHLSISAGSNRCDNAIKPTFGSVVNNPATFLILVDLLNLSVELCLLFEAVSFPELGNLANDLLTVGVAALPLDRGVESVHY